MKGERNVEEMVVDMDINMDMDNTPPAIQCVDFSFGG